MQINPYLVGGGILGAVGLAYLATRGKPTYFTILLENHSAAQILGGGARAGMPYLDQLANAYGNATNYHNGNVHPSLPNYLLLTSGQTWGITDDSYHLVRDRGANLFAQLSAAGIPWRAYAESMGQPCRTSDGTLYASRHNPAVYYDSIVGNRPLCTQNVVDLTNLWSDLAADSVRYAWITPNLVSDVHDGTKAQGDAWLRTVIPRIMASAGYHNGGAIFILFDESDTGSDLLPAVVISDRLRTHPMVDTTPYTHRSYLAGMQDLLGLPRLPSTVGVTSMAGMLR